MFGLVGSKILVGLAVIVPLLAASGAARADTIPISVSQDFTVGDGNDCCNLTPQFATIDFTFNLPVGFTNAVLNTFAFSADDRAVLQLNGVNVSNTGIFNSGSPPAVGGFSFLPDGSDNAPFTFIYSNDTTVFAPIIGPFLVGLNTLHFIINNTFEGIVDGQPTPLVPGNPMNLAFEGSVSFDAAGVATPLPATLPLFASGLGALGLIGWRRKNKKALSAA